MAREPPRRALARAARRFPGARRLARLALLLPLLAACSFSLPGAPGRPAPRVALVTPDGLIATITPGGQPVILTPAAPDDANDPARRRYNWPIWSPDGRRIAYQAFDGVGNSGAFLVAEPDGANRVIIQELTRGYPIFHSWSPDGRTLAMLAGGDDTLDLTLGDASGRGQARHLVSGQPLFSSWSPDSQALLVHTGGSTFSNDVGQLAVLPTGAGAQPERIDVDPNDFRAPAWSPTGAYQAVAGDNGIGEPALFLRAQDGVPRRFADLTGPPAVLWSPSGDRLAWSSLEDPPFAFNGLYVATPDGKTRLQLTDERLLAFVWSPDGSQLAYFTPDETEQALLLRVIPSAGGPPRTLAAFQPTREFIQFVTYFDQYAQVASIWSADSRTLLYAGWPPGADTNGPASLVTVPADGSGAGQTLTTGRIGFFAPEPSAAR